MIQVEPVGAVSVVRLDRAEKRNALTPGMLANLSGALDRSMSARAVVLSGVGPVFCAGFDLFAGREDPEVMASLMRGLSGVVASLRGMPCPVVASAHGAAIAGGCAMLGGADFVVTHAGATLGYPVVRLGISPAVSGPYVAAGIGSGAARSRLLDSGLIDGAEALRLGLASHEAASAEACEAMAIEVAQGLASKPRHALAFTRRWLAELDGTGDAARAKAGLEASLSLVGSAESRERLEKLWAGGGRGGRP